MYPLCFSGSGICIMERERNKIKHDDKQLSLLALKKMIEKRVRNKLSLMRTKDGMSIKGVM